MGQRGGADDHTQVRALPEHGILAIGVFVALSQSNSACVLFFFSKVTDAEKIGRYKTGFIARKESAKENGY